LGQPFGFGGVLLQLHKILGHKNESF
jgi:hypothetical protein